MIESTLSSWDPSLQLTPAGEVEKKDLTVLFRLHRMWRANIGPGEGSGVPGGAKNQARGRDMIDKGTDRIPRRWSTLKAVKWKDSRTRFSPPQRRSQSIDA